METKYVCVILACESDAQMEWNEETHDFNIS